MTPTCDHCDHPAHPHGLCGAETERYDSERMMDITYACGCIAPGCCYVCEP